MDLPKMVILSKMVSDEPVAAVKRGRPHQFYRQLDASLHEIRLIKLRRGRTFEEQKEYWLTTVPLDDAPKYVALSYCWGDPQATTTIEVLREAATDENCENVKVRQLVTENLHAALQQVWAAEVKYIWIDSICINQKDIQERCQQITLMGNIYSQATRVMAWLGTEDQDTRAAKAISSTTQAEVAYIRAISCRPYFGRMWIIQELSKAQKVDFWCDGKVTELDNFFEILASKIWTHDDSTAYTHDERSQVNRLIALYKFRKSEQQSRSGTPRMALSQAIAASWGFSASDPHDMLYALLGLTVDGSDVVGIPSYRKPYEVVFRSAFNHMIESQHRSALILLARGSNGLGDSSWMPRWSPKNSVTPWIHASLGVIPARDRIPPRIEGALLRVVGCWIDTVVDLKFNAPKAVGPLPNGPGQNLRRSLGYWAQHFGRGRTHFSTGAMPAGADIHEANLLALESAVRQAAKYSMRMVHLARSGFCIAHEDARNGDQIFRLCNCPLPVILRPKSDNCFTLVGEVYVDVEQPDWAANVWREFGHATQPPSNQSVKIV